MRRRPTCAPPAHRFDSFRSIRHEPRSGIPVWRVKLFQQYSGAETERMMKLQDVLLKAMGKKITWWEAAELIGVTGRTMRRWRGRLERDGYSGLVDRRKGKPSDKRVPLAKVEEVLRLFQRTYFDLNLRHFQRETRCRKRCKEPGWWRMEESGESIGGAENGGQCPCMLLHIDGSKHQWFDDERWYDLIVILDDATSGIYYAQLVER